MTEIEVMKKHATHLEGEVGAEEKYLVQEEEYLMKLLNDLKKDPSAAEKDVDRALKFMRRKVGRTERYVNRGGTKVLGDMKELERYLPAKLLAKLKTLEEPIQVLLNQFLAVFSRQQGEYVKELKELKTKVDVLEKEFKAKERDDQKVYKLTAVVMASANALLVRYKKMEKWLAGEIAVIKDYESFLDYLDQL